MRRESNGRAHILHPIGLFIIVRRIFRVLS